MSATPDPAPTERQIVGRAIATWLFFGVIVAVAQRLTGSDRAPLWMVMLVALPLVVLVTVIRLRARRSTGDGPR